MPLTNEDHLHIANIYEVFIQVRGKCFAQIWITFLIQCLNICVTMSKRTFILCQ